jgi:hypothetical protein
MRRRKFIQTLAVTPAAALPVTTELQAQQSAPPRPAPPAEDAPKLEMASLDAAAETVPRFFNAQQLAALRMLSDILLPPLNGMPGALEAGAPEFLDFYLSKSPAERQQLYKGGLDTLNAQAQKQFKKAFADLDAAQAGTLLAPLRQPWTYEPPADPFCPLLARGQAGSAQRDAQFARIRDGGRSGRTARRRDGAVLVSD